MRNTAVVRKTSAAVKLLNVLTVIMILVAGIVLIRMINELNRVLVRDPYGGIEYSLQDGDYADMVRQYYYRHYDVAPFGTPHEEAYQLAAYADAAFRHQFFLAVEDGEMAARMQTRMDTAREQSASLAIATEDIDQILERISLYH